jgi:excisionase family DNA binding protein
MAGRPTDGDELLTPSEVAALFRVDPKTVTRWAKAGKLTSIRTLGGHRRYRAGEVYSLLDRTPGMHPEPRQEYAQEQRPPAPRPMPVRPTMPRPGVPRQSGQPQPQPQPQTQRRTAPRTINLSSRSSEPRR